MGQEIVYCCNCQKRLLVADFEQGRAQRLGDKIACSACAEDLKSFMTPEERAALRSTTKVPRETKVRTRTGATTQLPSARPAEARPTSTGKTALRSRMTPPPQRAVEPPPEGDEAPPEGEAPSSKKKILLLAGAGGGLVAVIVVVLILLLGKGKKGVDVVVADPSAAPAPGAARAAEPAKPLLRGRDLFGAQALEAAQLFARDNPEDLQGQIERFDKVVWDWDATAAAGEAKKTSEGLKARLKESIEKKFAEVEEQIGAPLGREEFRLALDLLDRARKQEEKIALWGQLINKRSEEIRLKAGALYEELRKKAEELKGDDGPAQLRKIREQIARWGLERHVADFEKQFPAEAGADPVAAVKAPASAGPPAPPLPERSAGGKDYLGRWERAAGRATAREYDSALAEITVAARGAEEDAVKKEAAQDGEELRQVAALYGEIAQALAQLPRWSGLAVERYDGAAVKAVVGSIIQCDPERVELKVAPGKDSVFVELSEATSASLAELLSRRKEKKVPDAKALAIFHLLDGNWQAALKAVGGKVDRVQPKYWHYAKVAREKASRSDAAAAHSARTLYYAAEREYRNIKTRGQAVEKYRTLVRDYGDVPLVGRHLARLRSRADSCREYLFLPRDMTASGSFEITRQPSGDAWTSAEDQEELQMAQYNYVEFEFFALPETVYRCWLLLGGCCTESFSYLYQTSDLKEKNPERPREMLEPAPGSGCALWAPAVTYKLKKTHASHAKKDQPKEPSTWVWVDFKLPKYAAPGDKRVRLLTLQQGFSIAQAVVSSTLKKAPGEPELRELERLRAENPPSGGDDVDPALVGHWTFDEGAGTVVGDFSGTGHFGSFEGKPSWGAGKVGGGLAFDGTNEAVVIPDSDRLRISSDMTLALWVKKASESGDWQRIVGKGDSALRNYGIWEEQGGSKKVMFQQFNSEGKEAVTLKSKKDVDAGKWYHLAAVVRGSQVTLFVNGAVDATGRRTQKPATSKHPVTIGYGQMHAGFPGAIDDVRIYNRALSKDEVKELYEGKKK